MTAGLQTRCLARECRRPASREACNRNGGGGGGRVCGLSETAPEECTGLALPTKHVRNCLNTRSTWTSTLQKRCAYS